MALPLFGGRPFVVCNEHQYQWLMDELDRVGLLLEAVILRSVAQKYEYGDKVVYCIEADVLETLSGHMQMVKDMNTWQMDKWHKNWMVRHWKFLLFMSVWITSIVISIFL